MPTRTMEYALQTWRDGERVLESQPIGSAERKRVSTAIIEVRAVYASLAEMTDVSAEYLDAARKVIDEARIAIDSVNVPRPRNVI